MTGSSLIFWALLAFFLFFLLYMAIVIREERTAFLESARAFFFHDFLFQVPSWWFLLEKRPFRACFGGKNKNWKVSFFWYPENSSKTLSSFIQERGYIFDQKNKDYEKYPSSLSFYSDLRRQGLESPFKEQGEKKEIWMERMEGTVSTGDGERKYVDIFLIGPKEQSKNAGQLLALFESSVLGGLLEGPYFEEMMSGLSFNFSWEKRP